MDASRLVKSYYSPLREVVRTYVCVCTCAYILVRVQIAAAIIQGTGMRRRGKRLNANTESRFSKSSRFNDGSAVFVSARVDLIENFNSRPTGRSLSISFRICVFGQVKYRVRYHARSNLSYEETRYRQIPADQADQGPRVNHPFVTL